MLKTAEGDFRPSDSRLQNLARQFRANQISGRLKDKITETLRARPIELDISKRRARMILQSAGWLDIDKFIQHRPPIDKVGFWKRPTAPQRKSSLISSITSNDLIENPWNANPPPLRQIVTLDHFSPHNTPIFRPATCSTPTCRRPIHGSSFTCTLAPSQCTAAHAAGPICQDCQDAGSSRDRNRNNPVENKHATDRDADRHLAKHYKTCVLTAGAIPPTTGRAICRCSTVARFDADGRPRDVFPVRHGDAHRVAPAPCGLLVVGEAVAEAKYLGVRRGGSLGGGGEGREEKKDGKTLDAERRKAERKIEEERARRRREGRSSVVQFGTETINEKEADADIPWFLRGATDRVPFGNVHMALRVGPLMVENGVEDSKRGALLTTRQMPSWSLSGEVGDGGGEWMLALSEDRQVFKHCSPPQRPKRYKAALKQVVGGLFAGVCLADLEEDIVNLVADASRKDLDGDDNAWNRRQRWDRVLEPIHQKLHDLMDSRVASMLGSVVGKLLDPEVKVGWDRENNNCQMFCDALIDYSLYRGLIPDKSSVSLPGAAGEIPPYLMSFVCHRDSYRRERKVQTKFDVPSGLCEEYLLKFRFGFYLDSDIIDTMHEYWYDWGNFGGPLYPHQPLFPWDCTEAYGRSAVRCGECNVAKHAWAFPFDSWSVAELHLTRGTVMYPRPSADGDAAFARAHWMTNRLSVLLAQDALLAGARAMAGSAEFRRQTTWLAVNPDRRLDRLKLGGIHRAQPFSHQWEEGKYHEYFIAEWAHLEHEDKVAEYERQREERRKLPDIKVDTGDGSSESRDWDDDGYMGWSDDWAALWMLSCLDPFYADGWDGEYSQEETMSRQDLALLESVDAAPDVLDSRDDDRVGTSADYFDDGGGDGGCDGD